MQASETPPLARAIIDESMSPFCPGLTLQACPSPQADSLRKDIIARVKAGETKSSILNRLHTDFGSAIRGAPETTGFGLVAWIAPGIILLMAAFFLTRWLRRRTAMNSNSSPPTAPRAKSAKNDLTYSSAERTQLDALLKRDN